jgi:hypothetical protein
MTHRHVLAAPLVIGAALIAVASASAAAPWTDPVTIPGAGPTPAPVLITDSGRALALPSTDRTDAAPAGAVTEIVALYPATGAPAGIGLGLPITAVQAATYGTDHFVVAGSTLDARGTVSDRSLVEVAYGNGGGDVGPLRGVTGSTGEHSFALAVNDGGVIAMVLGNTKERRLVIRRPGVRGFVEAFSTKVGAQGRGATVAVGAKGDVLMVWENEHHVFALHVGPSGGVGAVHHIGDGVQSHLQAAVDSDGRLLVAWASQRVDEGEADTPASIFFATAAPGHGFGSARLLEESGPTGTGRYIYDPAVRLVSSGASLLAWTGFDAATQHYVVRVAQIDGGHVGTSQTVSVPASNAVLGDLSVNAAGAAAVIWRTGIAGADSDGTPQQVVVAMRLGPGQPFAAPEAVSPAGITQPYQPQITLAPRSAAALAEYGQLAQTASSFRVAARPAP